MLISDSPASIHFLVHFMVQRYEFSDSIMAGSFYPLKHFIYDIFRLFVIMKNQLLTLCFLAIAGVAGAQTCDVTFDGPYAKIYNEGGRSTHRLVHLGNNNRLAGFIIDNSEEVDQVGDLVYAKNCNTSGKSLITSILPVVNKCNNYVSSSATWDKDGSYIKYYDFEGR
jgi:hypothetical protein